MKLRQARTALALVLVAVAATTMVALRHRPLPAVLSVGMGLSDEPSAGHSDWQGRPLVFLVRVAHPPFSSFLAAAQEPRGLDVDVARSVADCLGVAAQFVPVPEREVESRFLAGEGDVFLSSACSTPANRRLLAFSLPYCRSRPALLALGAAAEGLRKGVPPSAPLALLAGSFGGRVPEGQAGNALTVVGSWPELVACLRDGRCVAALVDVLSAHYRLAQGADTDLVLLPAAVPIHGASSVSMVARRGSHDLVQAIDGALREMQRSGALRSIHRRYYPFDIE